LRVQYLPPNPQDHGAVPFNECREGRFGVVTTVLDEAFE
jgi:hypothetical protein